MKKMFLFLIIIGLSFSCAKKVSQENNAVKQETNKVVVGGDSDAHSCKASAGYRWSDLKNKCVRLFEVGTQLSHSEEAGKTFVTVAYVIFQGNKAELFLDTQNEPIILERKSEGDSWTKDDYQLIPWKGYVLKKGDKILYTGQ